MSPTIRPLRDQLSRDDFRSVCVAMVAGSLTTFMIAPVLRPVPGLTGSGIVPTAYAVGYDLSPSGLVP